MILGVDPGERRVGLAVADQETRFARPLEVIDRHEQDHIARIETVVQEIGATTVVIGRPTSLSGSSGGAVELQRELVDELRARLEVEVCEFDERLTTVVATKALRASGIRRSRRRELVDAVAAQVMLQGYLDTR